MVKPLISLMAAAFCLGAAGLAQAQSGAQPAPMSPKAQYSADSNQALSRYKADLRICSDEPESAGRMQCKRDAKTGYDQAIANARARLAAASQASAPPQGARSAPSPGTPARQHVVCADCGRVTAVQQIEKEGEGSAVGMIAGGAAGALLGHQIGAGLGKNLATLAGAAGGAYAGKQIEQRMNTRTAWVVTARFADGGTSRYEFAQHPGLQVGDTVKRSGRTIVRQ